MNRRTFFSKAAAFVAGCALMVKANSIKPENWSVETVDLSFDPKQHYVWIRPTNIVGEFVAYNYDPSISIG